mgnify:CR=1 FL=1|tara:strand:+ start:84 stop:1082 length:999 start_codon:yes stop_codon:yes gene_type:complete
MKRYLSFILLFCSLLICQEKLYVKEYTYIASELESMSEARDNAKAQAIKMVLDEISIFVKSEITNIVQESNGNVNDFFESYIKSFNQGLVRIKIIDESWNGREFYIKANIWADPDKIINGIKENASKFIHSQSHSNKLQTDKKKVTKEEKGIINRWLENRKKRKLIEKEPFLLNYFSYFSFSSINMLIDNSQLSTEQDGDLFHFRLKKYKNFQFKVNVTSQYPTPGAYYCFGYSYPIKKIKSSKNPLASAWLSANFWLGIAAEKSDCGYYCSDPLYKKNIGFIQSSLQFETPKTEFLGVGFRPELGATLGFNGISSFLVRVQFLILTYDSNY